MWFRIQIRIGFTAVPDTDPDPVFFVNVDPDTDLNPDPGYDPKIGKKYADKFFTFF
jgi:hypothetical protein